MNGLKHRGGYLHQVVLWDRVDVGTARLGYYLEEVWEGEATGPSWRVHRDGNSGFSFSRDLRLHLYYLYELSERLSEVIIATCRTWHRREITPTAVEDHKGRWVRLVKALVTQPYEPLLNELSWPTPMIELQEDSCGQITLIAEYPVGRSNTWHVGDLRVQVGASGGGPGSSFKVPYVGKPKKPNR